jgi:hypothetical protein
MSKKEILAYAITHAPRGQKGGPYVADMGYAPVLDLEHAWRSDASEPERARAESKKRRGTRVIRIVRAARPSEAEAVAVLRDMFATWDARGIICVAAFDRARRVLAGAGPDPMPVVRAALRFTEHCTPSLEGSAWFEATCGFIDAVDAYRKAGGTP